MLLFFLIIIIIIKLKAECGANVDFGDPMIFPVASQPAQIFYLQISSPISNKQTIFTVHIVNLNMKNLLDLCCNPVSLRVTIKFD